MSKDSKNRISVAPPHITPPDYNISNVAPATIFNDISNELKNNVTQELKQESFVLASLLPHELLANTQGLDRPLPPIGEAKLPLLTRLITDCNRR
jgi:hypothetical protein